MTLDQWVDITQIGANALIAGTVVVVVVLVRKAIEEQKEALKLRNEYLESIAVKDWREQLKAIREETAERIDKTIKEGERKAAEERDKMRLLRIRVLPHLSSEPTEVDARLFGDDYVREESAKREENLERMRQLICDLETRSEDEALECIEEPLRSEVKERLVQHRAGVGKKE